MHSIELRLFLGQGIPPAHTINVAHLTLQQWVQFLTSFSYDEVLVEHRTQQLPDTEQMRYVLCHGSRLNKGTLLEKQKLLNKKHKTFRIFNIHTIEEKVS